MEGYRAGLSPREIEVLSLIAQGYSNQRIAEMMVLTRKSVENYINRLTNRFNMKNMEGRQNRVMLTLLYQRGQYRRFYE